MKNIVRGIIFWIIALAFIFVMWTIAEVLSKIVTINFIMNLVYVLLPACIVYILKNFQEGSESMKIACIVNVAFILMVLFNLVILAKQTEEFEEISKKYRDLNKRNMRMLIKIQLIMIETLTAEDKIQKIEEVIQFNNHTELE